MMRTSSIGILLAVACTGKPDAPPTTEWTARCGHSPTDIPSSCPCVDTSIYAWNDSQFDCFICGLYHCEPHTSGVWKDFGATWIQVNGPVGEACAFSLYNDLEGTLEVYNCLVPLPVIPWDEWAQSDSLTAVPASLSPYCDLVETCSPTLGIPCEGSHPTCP